MLAQNVLDVLREGLNNALLAVLSLSFLVLQGLEWVAWGNLSGRNRYELPNRTFVNSSDASKSERRCGFPAWRGCLCLQATGTAAAF